MLDMDSTKDNRKTSLSTIHGSTALLRTCYNYDFSISLKPTDNFYNDDTLDAWIYAVENVINL